MERGPDPADPSFLDEKSVRDEFTRVAEVCLDCRRCTDRCGTFPTLFDLVDQHEDRDPGRLTPAQQDTVAGECFQCGRCVAGCPFAPAVHELAVDVPALVLRLTAMRRATGQTPIRARITTWLVTTSGPFARAVRAPRGSFARRMVGTISDLSPDRMIWPVARPTFSGWYRRRRTAPPPVAGDQVTIFPTCIVDREAPSIGRALVGVCERNRVACDVSAVGCCGAPWLHAGDTRRFRKLAERNVRTLAAEIRRGRQIVVLQPTCHRVITVDAVACVGGPDAELVAAHTHDATDYLLRRHRAGGLDTGFSGEVPRRVAYHAGEPLRPDGRRPVGADVVALTGAEVVVVDRVAGAGVTWGLRVEHAAASIAMGRQLAEAMVDVDAEAMVGDDHRANTVVFEQTGTMPIHPVEFVARAYGLVADA